MKTMIVCLLVCLFWTTDDCVAQDCYSKEYQNALRYGAKVKITVAARDSDGRSASNATVNVFFEQKDGNQYKVEGKTDSIGMHVVEGMTRSSIGGSVEKEGYYRSVFHLPFATGQERIDDDRWLPWNPTIPVVLREIRNPIPMYVKIFDGILTNGATCGFDCEAGDFVEPYGRGVESDFMVTCKGAGIPGTKTTHSIEMLVPDPAGGFMAKKKHSSSAFKADYLAPEQGYSTNIFAKMEYDSQHGVSGSSVFYGDEYLVFKSRIKRDEEGNIVSANYGKFYSGIEFMRGVGEHVGVGFLYYFNPTPNDRNIEFDGKNNLFKPGWNSKLNWSREP